MLKHRILPVLLTDGNGQCIKPVAFQRPYRKLGTMEQYIQVVERRSVDELIIIDIEATAQGRKPNFEKLRAWCDNLFCPVTYGGGITSLDDIRLALENGADKVAIKSECCNFKFISKASKKFGSQCIVGVIDVLDNQIISPWFDAAEDEWKVAVWEPLVYIKELEYSGVGEIILTDRKKDGKMEGYNLDLIKDISQSISIPVVALGGCGEPDHMQQAIEAGASAVAAGSMFLFTDETPRSCAEFLNKHNIPVRL